MSYLENGAGSLGVHFIGPIFAIIDFLAFDYRYKSNLKHSLYASIPPLCYFVFIAVLGQCGYRWNGMIAPYNFMNYSAKTGWFGLDLSLTSEETLGIGVFYMIIILLVIYVVIGIILLSIKDIVRRIHNI